MVGNAVAVGRDGGEHFDVVGLGGELHSAAGAGVNSDDVGSCEEMAVVGVEHSDDGVVVAPNGSVDGAEANEVGTVEIGCERVVTGHEEQTSTVGADAAPAVVNVAPCSIENGVDDSACAIGVENEFKVFFVQEGCGGRGKFGERRAEVASHHFALDRFGVEHGIACEGERVGVLGHGYYTILGSGGNVESIECDFLCDKVVLAEKDSRAVAALGELVTGTGAVGEMTERTVGNVNDAETLKSFGGYEERVSVVTENGVESFGGALYGYALDAPYLEIECVQRRESQYCRRGKTEKFCHEKV